MLGEITEALETKYNRRVKNVRLELDSRYTDSFRSVRSAELVSNGLVMTVGFRSNILDCQFNDRPHLLYPCDIPGIAALLVTVMNQHMELFHVVNNQLLVIAFDGSPSEVGRRVEKFMRCWEMYHDIICGMLDSDPMTKNLRWQRILAVESGLVAGNLRGYTDKERDEVLFRVKHAVKTLLLSTLNDDQRSSPEVVEYLELLEEIEITKSTGLFALRDVESVLEGV